MEKVESEEMFDIIQSIVREKCVCMCVCKMNDEGNEHEKTNVSLSLGKMAFYVR